MTTLFGFIVGVGFALLINHGLQRRKHPLHEIHDDFFFIWPATAILIMNWLRYVDSITFGAVVMFGLLYGYSKLSIPPLKKMVRNFLKSFLEEEEDKDE